MIFILVRNNYPSKISNNVNNSISVVNSLMKDEWMGIYFNKKKIGYSHWMMVPDKEKNVFIINEQSYMKFFAGGENIELRINNAAIVSPDFKIKEFTSFLLTSHYKLKIEGKLSGNNLDIKFTSDKTDNKYTITLKEIPTITSNINQYILNKGLIVNNRYIIPYYDPFTLSIKNIVINIEKKEKINIYGEFVRAYKIREDYDGIIIYTWLKDDGTRLREESPMGFILKRERQDEAINILDINDKTDIIKSTSVIVKKHVKEPRKINYLKIEIGGININGFSLLNQGRQRIDKNTLEIFSLPIKEEKSDNIDYFLSSGFFIQSDDPLIENKAREIIGIENDAYKKAELISRWLFKNIKKKITVSIPDAVTVLKTKTRSEERRVGKECRSRWSPYH